MHTLLAAHTKGEFNKHMRTRSGTHKGRVQRTPYIHNNIHIQQQPAARDLRQQIQAVSSTPGPAAASLHEATACLHRRCASRWRHTQCTSNFIAPYVLNKRIAEDLSVLHGTVAHWALHNINMRNTQTSSCRALWHACVADKQHSHAHIILPAKTYAITQHSSTAASQYCNRGWPSTMPAIALELHGQQKGVKTVQHCHITYRRRAVLHMQHAACNSPCNETGNVQVAASCYRLPKSTHCQHTNSPLMQLSHPTKLVLSKSKPHNTGTLCCCDTKTHTSTLHSINTHTGTAIL
jgi:hypothetical protein